MDWGLVVLVERLPSIHEALGTMLGAGGGGRGAEVVVHTCNPGAWEVEPGGSGFESHTHYIVSSRPA